MRFKGGFFEMSFEKVCKKTGFFEDDAGFLMKKRFLGMALNSLMTKVFFLSLLVTYAG